VTECQRARAGFVAQIGLRSGFPSPRTDLPYSLSLGYAKHREAIEDRSADLDLSNLPLEVSCGEALTKQFHTMHLGVESGRGLNRIIRALS